MLGAYEQPNLQRKGSGVRVASSGSRESMRAQAQATAAPGAPEKPRARRIVELGRGSDAAGAGDGGGGDESGGGGRSGEGGQQAAAHVRSLESLATVTASMLRRAASGRVRVDGLGSDRARAHLTAQARVDKTAASMGRWKGLFQAASRGDLHQTRSIIEKERVLPNARNESGQTALMVAAKYGRAAEVEYLILLGAFADSQDHSGTTPLMYACEHGDVPTVGMILKHTCGVNITNNHGWTALNLAVVRGHTQVVKMLLQQGFASGDIPDNTGATAVLRAAELGRTAMLEALLEAGADPDAAARNGITPMMAAAENGHDACVRVLAGTGKVSLDAKEHLQGATALFLACRGGHMEAVRALLTAGANPNAPEKLQGFHPIHIAAWQGHTNVVDLLMGRRGVTVFALTKDLLTLEDVAASRGHNAVVELLVEFETEAALSRSDIMRQLLTKGSGSPHLAAARRAWKSGSRHRGAARAVLKSMHASALIQAASEGHCDVVQTLLAAGADPDYRDPRHNGVTSLLVAAKSNHEQVVQALLAAGVDTDTQEKKFGLSALMVAASLGHVAIVRALCDAGADTNLQNTHLSTALMLACQSNQTSVCKVLLAYGADMGLQDSHGATAVMRACLVTNGAALVQMLVQLCPHPHRVVNIQAEDGTTPLMVAAERGHVDTVQCLLKHGADPRLVDSQGDTALAIAGRRDNNSEVVQVLTKHAAQRGYHAASAVDLRAPIGNDDRRVSVARLPAPRRRSGSGVRDPARPPTGTRQASTHASSTMRVSPLNLAPITGGQAGSSTATSQRALPRSQSGVPARRGSLDNVQAGVHMSAPSHVDRFFLVDDKHGRPLQPSLVAHAVDGSPAPANRRLKLQASRSFRTPSQGDQALAAVRVTRVPGSVHFKAATTPQPERGVRDGEAEPTPRTRLGQSALQAIIQQRSKQRMLALLPPKMSFMPSATSGAGASTVDGTQQRRGSTSGAGADDEGEVWQVGRSMRNLLSASQDGSAVPVDNAATPATEPAPTAVGEPTTPKHAMPAKASSHERNLSLFRLHVTRATNRVAWVQPLARKLTACGRSNKSIGAGSGQ